MRVANELGPSATVLVNLSGRGDKDVQTVEKARGSGRAAGDVGLGAGD
jgi:tryptophan synthase beta subunit